MKNLCIIPARAGSKRIPKKNIKPFMGKPIIAYSIEAALKSKLFDEVMVSTDSEEFAGVARQFGAKVPFLRSEKTANDFATTVDVLLEVLDIYEQQGKIFDNICCLYSTAPLVTVENLYKAYSALNDDIDASFTVVEYSYPIQRSLIENEGKIAIAFPQYLNSRTQDLKKHYHDAGQFYFIKVDALKKYKTLWAPRTAPLILSELMVQDLDTETDWKLAGMKYQILRNK